MSNESKQQQQSEFHKLLEEELNMWDHFQKGFPPEPVLPMVDKIQSAPKPIVAPDVYITTIEHKNKETER